MPNRRLSVAVQAGTVLLFVGAFAAHTEWGKADVRSGSTALRAVSSGTAADGCDILILWHTYRGSIDYNASQVRVKGLTWVNLRGPQGPLAIHPPPPETRTNGRVWNWKEELKQKRCDRDRRYRFKVVAPDSTGEPVRSNEPYAGTERWLYVPSTTGWTRKTNVDVGYLDWCVIDGTKCSKPYYPSGPTPILEW